MYPAQRAYKTVELSGVVGMHSEVPGYSILNRTCKKRSFCSETNRIFLGDLETMQELIPGGVTCKFSAFVKAKIAREVSWCVNTLEIGNRIIIDQILRAPFWRSLKKFVRLLLSVVVKMVNHSFPMIVVY